MDRPDDDRLALGTGVGLRGQRRQGDLRHTRMMFVSGKEDHVLDPLVDDVGEQTVQRFREPVPSVRAKRAGVAVGRRDSARQQYRRRDDEHEVPRRLVLRQPLEERTELRFAHDASARIEGSHLALRARVREKELVTALRIRKPHLRIRRRAEDALMFEVRRLAANQVLTKHGSWTASQLSWNS